MKLGVVSNALLPMEFEEGLDYLQGQGVGSIEIACAGYHGNRTYGDLDVLGDDPGARDRWLEAIESRGLAITALAIHGAPLSPDPAVAETYDQQFRQACEVAEAIGVTRLTLLGGLPAGNASDSTPCWIVNAWPPENQDILRWQWEERVIPYWEDHGQIAASHSCRLCFEMHPCDVLHNPAALLRLRAAVGEVIGCNFDPSHLFWQGMDPIESMRALSDAIYHVHAKDAVVNDHVVRCNGLFDATPFSEIGQRAWDFRTVGFGHPEPFWREFISTLRAIGYDDVLSIEHEDDYMDPQEGLEKAVSFLAPMLFERPRGVSSWELVS